MARQKQLSEGEVIWAGLALGVTGIAYFGFIRPWWEQRKLKGQLTGDQASTIKAKPGKVIYTIAGKPVKSMNLSTIVMDLHDALSFPADEARAIRVFLTTPFGYVKEVERMYLDKYSENLKEKMASVMSDVEFIKVKFYFE